MSGNAMGRGALGGECDLESRGFAFFWASFTWSTHHSPTTSVCAMLILRVVLALLL